MSNDQINTGDPLEFVRNMWGSMGFSLPGMVVPTFDVDELEKRIADLKAVEGWLRMNLSMLQMTIQGMEMQKATLTAVKAMGSMASDASRSFADAATPAAPPAGDDAAAALSQAAMWPWNMMQQMQEHLQQQAEEAQAQQAAAKPKKAPTRKPRKS